MSCLRFRRRLWLPALVVLLLGVGVCDSLIAGPLFPNPLYETGSYPLSMTTGDFNGDHHPDLAVMDFREDFIDPREEGTAVWVYLWDGDGYFTPAGRNNVGLNPFGAAAVDLDQDGDDDLVVANFGSSDLSILISRGDGSFESQVRFPVANGPTTVCAGLLDSDPYPDLVVIALLDNTVQLLRGNGMGDFTDAGTLAAGVSPEACLVADFDADGSLDLAVANASSDDVSVLPGAGNGTFAPALHYPVGDSPETLVSGDFNEDGALDLATGNTQGSDISILLGRVDGTFEPEQRATSHRRPYSLAAGDHDGDGHADLAAVDSYQYLSAELLRGNGDGSFQTSAQLDGSVNAAVQMIQMDADAPLEIVLSQYQQFSHPPFQTPSLLVLGDNPTAPPTPPIDLGIPVDPYTGFIMDFPGNLDGDGHLDLLLAGGSGDWVEVSAHLGQGDGSFELASTLGFSAASNGIAAGDLNGDGRLDLVLALADYTTHAPRLQVVLTGPGGSLEALDESPGGDATMALGDLDEDGSLDLISGYQVDYQHNEIGIRTGDGDGTFDVEQRFTIYARPTGMRVVDLDGDGHLDVIVENGLASQPDAFAISLLFGRGDGTFGPEQRLIPGYGYRALPGDLDGNGDIDILVYGHDEQYHEFSIVLDGHGDGTFAERPLAEPVYGDLLADLDADGDLDLVFGGALLDIYLNDGSGSFSRPALHFVTNLLASTLPGSGDFNEDGRVDLAMDALWLNNGPFPAPVAHAQAPAQVECAAADGTPVLLDGTASTGTIDHYEWFLDYALPGQTLLGEGAILPVDLPPGEHHITLIVIGPSGQTGTDDLIVQVSDTTPPALLVSVMPAFLWPPNGTYHDVHVTATAQDACGPATVVLVSVTSSEPETTRSRTQTSAPRTSTSRFRPTRKSRRGPTRCCIRRRTARGRRHKPQPPLR